MAIFSSCQLEDLVVVVVVVLRQGFLLRSWIINSSDVTPKRNMKLNPEKCDFCHSKRVSLLATQRTRTCFSKVLALRPLSFAIFLIGRNLVMNLRSLRDVPISTNKLISCLLEDFLVVGESTIWGRGRAKCVVHYLLIRALPPSCPQKDPTWGFDQKSRD